MPRFTVTIELELEAEDAEAAKAEATLLMDISAFEDGDKWEIVGEPHLLGAEG